MATKLSKRTTFQVAAATQLLAGIVEDAGKTTITFNVDPAEALANIDRAIAEVHRERADGWKGFNTALHGLRRAVEEAAGEQADLGAAEIDHNQGVDTMATKTKTRAPAARTAAEPTKAQARALDAATEAVAQWRAGDLDRKDRDAKIVKAVAALNNYTRVAKVVGMGPPHVRAIALKNGTVVK